VRIGELAALVGVSTRTVRHYHHLGLSLDEIRDVLADDRGRELREVLLELDADLARQQEAIAARRRRLAALLEEGELHPDSAVSPEMAAVLRELPAEVTPAQAEVFRLLVALLKEKT